jgi:hypothetical protein
VNALRMLAAVAILAPGGAVVALWERYRELEGRLEVLEEAPARRAGAAGEAGLDTTPARTPALEPARVSLAAFETLVERVAEIRERVESGARAEGSVAGPAEVEFDEAVREAFVRLLEDPGFRNHVTEAVREPAIGKKPPFDVLARALALDAAQQTRLREDLRSIQTSLFELLSQERPVGRVPLQAIAEAEALPESDPRRAELWLELVQWKIPGSEETYIQRAVALAADFRTRAADYLRPEQATRLGSFDLDLFGIPLD